MDMPKKIEDYIAGVEFRKKSFGGVDEVDVLSHMKTICGMYNEELEQARAGALPEGSQEIGTELEEAKKALEALKTENESLKSQLAAAREGSASEDDIQKAKEARERYEAEYNGIRELSAFIPTIKKEVTEQANAEAYKIVSAATERAHAIEAEAFTKKKDMEEDILALKESKDGLRSSVVDMVQKYEGLLKQLRQDMEKEAEERGAE